MTYKHKKGFSLIELITGLTLFVLFSFGIFQFFKLSMSSLHKTGQTLNANYDIRSCFEQLEQDTLKASYALLFEDYSEDLRSRLTNGSAGNFLLLVYNGEDEDINDSIPAPINKIVGYYLDQQDPLNLKIRRFESTLNNVNQGQAIEGHIPEDTAEVIHQHPALVYDVAGVMSDKAFYKVNNFAIMLGVRTHSGSGDLQHSRMLSSTFNISGT